MGKHGRTPSPRRLSATSLLALAVVVVLLGVGGVVVVHSMAGHDAVASSQAKPAGGASTPPPTAPSRAATTPDSPAPSDSHGGQADDDTLGVPSSAPPVPAGTAFLTLGGDDGVVITPAEATIVVSGLWNMREKALASSSTSTLRQMEDGAALISDVDAMACRCTQYDVLPASGVSAIVPRSSRYPAYFFGEIAAQRDTVGVFEVFVVTRASAHAPWHVSIVSGFASDDDTTGDLDDTDWAGDAGTPMGADGHGFAQLAAIWQQAKNSGSKESGDFDSDSWMVSDRLDELAQYPQDKPQANGLRGHYTFAADPSVPPRAIEASLSDLVCGAIRETVVYTPAPGHSIRQDAVAPLFGAALAPGAYRSVTETTEWQVCLAQYGESKIGAFGWDPDYTGSLVGVAVPKGSHLPADPAQKLPDAGDSSDGSASNSASA